MTGTSKLNYSHINNMVKSLKERDSEVPDVDDVIDALESLLKDHKLLKETLEAYGDPFFYRKAHREGTLVDDLKVVPASDFEVLGQDMGMTLKPGGKSARGSLKRIIIKN